MASIVTRAAARRMGPLMMRTAYSFGRRYARRNAARLAGSLAQSAARAGSRRIFRAVSTRLRKRRRTSKRFTSDPGLSKAEVSFVPDNNTSTIVSEMVLSNFKIPMPLKGLGTGQRLTNSIFLKGVSVCGFFKTNSSAPLYVHMAVIQDTIKSDGLTTLDVRDGLLRNNVLTESRVLDFPATPPANWDVRFNCNPLAPESHNILMHKRWVMQDTSDKQRQQYKKVERYIKINRTIQLGEQLSDDRFARDIHVLIWWQSLHPNDHGVAGREVSYQMTNKIWWKPVFK